MISHVTFGYLISWWALNFWHSGTLARASVKLFESGVRTPEGLFFGVWYAGSIDFRRFRMPSLLIFGVFLGQRRTSEMRKQHTSKYARVYTDYWVINYW